MARLVYRVGIVALVVCGAFLVLERGLLGSLLGSRETPLPAGNTRTLSDSEITEGRSKDETNTSPTAKWTGTKGEMQSVTYLASYVYIS